MTTERFTSLIPNPPAAPASSADRSPAPEPWDVYKAAAAHNKLVRKEVALQSITQSLATHMLADLVLTESERLHLHATVYAALYEEVSTKSLLASIDAVAS